MLRRIEFWFDSATQAYLLVTAKSVKPGDAPLWWGCADVARMDDDACARVRGTRKHKL
jgi:hypothetical protein